MKHLEFKKGKKINENQGICWKWQITGYSLGGTHSENDLNIQYEVQPQEGQNVQELEVEDDLLTNQKPEDILNSLQERMKT